jgi:hypothetical protein
MVSASYYRETVAVEIARRLSVRGGSPLDVKGLEVVRLRQTIVTVENVAPSSRRLRDPSFPIDAPRGPIDEDGSAALILRQEVALIARKALEHVALAFDG